MLRRLLTAASASLLVALLVPVAVTAAAPTISGFTPTSGVLLSKVTITGTALTGATSVTFGGVAASPFTVNGSGTSIATAVPATAPSGPIRVTTPSGTATSATNFMVNPGVHLSPGSGPPTTTVTVIGSGYAAFETVDVYLDTTDMVLASTNGAGAFAGVSFKIPGTAPPGAHWVTVDGRASHRSSQAAFLVQTNWAQFHDGAPRTGYDPYENVLSPSTVANLGLDWTAKTGTSFGLSSPVVSGGVVYALSATTLFAYPAACASPCAPLWYATQNGQVTYANSPAVGNGMVFIAGTDVNGNGLVGAYRVGCATGGAQCTAGAWGNNNLMGGVGGSSPAVANGVVYVGSTDSRLYAFPAVCAAACNPSWVGTTGGPINGSPAVANGVVYVGSGDGRLHAFPAQCGSGGVACTALWETQADAAPMDTTPAIANGFVFVVGANNATSSLIDVFPATCVPSGGTCFATGQALDASLIQSSPAVAGGFVYVGDEGGGLRVFSIHCLLFSSSCSGGALVWTGTTGSNNAIESSPAIANGVVYVGVRGVSPDEYAFSTNISSPNVTCFTSSGHLFCDPIWTGATGAAVQSSPAIADGVLYTGSNDGNLYAFDLNTLASQAFRAPSRPDPAALHPNMRLMPSR